MAIRYGYPKGREDVEALAELFGAHTPVYDYRNGHFTMECEACDFMLFGTDREDAKRRFGEHFAGIVSDWLAALIEQARAEGKAEADAARAARVEALADEYDERSADTEDAERYPWGVAADDIRRIIPTDAATALDQVRAHAKAEGLREAAEHLAGLDGIRWPIEGVNEAYVDWLRGRARRLGGAL